MSQSSPFVVPEIKRLDLDDGSWVDVKKRLGVALQKRVESAIFKGVQGARDMVGRSDVTVEQVSVQMDASYAYLTKLEVYIVGWSFVDKNQRPVPVTIPAIHALDPDIADEIMKKLDAFLEEQRKERQSPFTPTNSESQSA